MVVLIFKLLQIVLLLFFSSKSTLAEKITEQSKSTYIIHMDESSMPAYFTDHLGWLESSLRSVSDTAEMLYTYKHVIHGFSTRLTKQEADLLDSKVGVLSVIPDARYELHTSRTPEFLGLENLITILPSRDNQSDVIIGLLDTGVWPERRSFRDKGLGPVPSRWKGECESGPNFTSSNCNRKLVGARIFPKGFEASVGPINETELTRSPRDDDGHGTHTSSTAGGSVVEGASLAGYASGTARGMATQARLAMYKVCWAEGCYFSDIVAGMDKAIEDGVDILSISLGGEVDEYFRDIISIGTFKAIDKGIFVSASAGNNGPTQGSLCNVAPWITTVGAGTIDRDFPAYVTTGDGKRYTGVSLYYGKLLPDSLPIVYAGNVSSTTSYCLEDSLVHSKVSGKIVICDRGIIPGALKGYVVKKAGGLGMVLANTVAEGENLLPTAHLIPGVNLGERSSTELKNYVFSDPNPTATLTFGGTKLGVEPSPTVAFFSSRGPNILTPQILKPDLIAPGESILAAWTGAVGPTGLTGKDKRHVIFNIISGTSMSCPHVSGLAAIIKGAHPDWSPATIRSAFMTTAYTTYKDGKTLLDGNNNNGKPATPFDFGAGHVNPVAALDPGLVYNTTVDDYLSFFCALNYTAQQIKQATGKDFTCDSSKTYRVEDLNYPSFAVPLAAASGGEGGIVVSTTVQYTRTLTNVGTPATYNVSVSSQSPAVSIRVEPQTLSFSQLNEKKSYTVTIFTSTSMPSNTTSFAHLVWSDGIHKVGSPIAFSWT